MFKCRLCGKTCESFSEFLFHVKRECKNFPHTRRCPVCGTRFRSDHLLKLHIVNLALVDAQHRNYILAPA